MARLMSQEGKADGPMRIRVVVALASALALTITSRAGESRQKWSGYDAPPGLVLRITTEESEVKKGEKLTVSWELENTGHDPIYVCQWPGAAYSTSWEMPDGTVKGVIPGYPSSRSVERKYFIQLKPGEALLGADSVNVFPTPSGQISVRGEYRSDSTGERFGLDGWRGRVYSNWIDIAVPKEE